MKVRLQIGVATIFYGLTVILLSIVVSVLYFGNRYLALRLAPDDMIKARALSVGEMLQSIRGTYRAVAAAARFVGEFPEQAQPVDG